MPTRTDGQRGPRRLKTGTGWGSRGPDGYYGSGWDAFDPTLQSGLAGKDGSETNGSRHDDAGSEGDRTDT